MTKMGRPRHSGIAALTTLAALTLLSACETSQLDEAPPMRVTATGVTDADSTAAMPQIRSRDTDRLRNAQIQSSTSVAQLSVDQLKTYVDRCRPGSAAPAGVDCSEIKLRVERLFQNENEVIDALAVLDRLGTGQAPQNTRTGDYVRRIIASGALVTPDLTPPPPEDVPDDPLNQFDPGFNPGTIISTTGGDG